MNGSWNDDASLFFRIATSSPETIRRVLAEQPPRTKDWDRAIADALIENAITILAERVAKLPDEVVPPDRRAQIARLALVWQFKLRVLERRLAHSLSVLTTAGIDVTLLKGAALAVTAYPSFADRPMADIDLLVDAVHAVRAHQVMQDEGWALRNADYREEAWNGHHHLPPLTDTSGSELRLEIHVAPIEANSPFQLDAVELLASSTRVMVGNAVVRVPDPHWHAVHAAIHFAWSHRFESGALNVFRDLAVLQKAPSFSWQRFVAVARATRSESSCYWTLRLARTLAELDFPAEVLDQLSPPIGKPALSVLERHFAQLALRSDYACPSVGLRARIWAFALQKNRERVDEAFLWHGSVQAERGSVGSSLRRVGSHLRRAGPLTLYVSRLLASPRT